MVRLSIFKEGERVMEHPLPRAVTSLGRHTDNDIVLDDLALSRFHARLEQRNANQVVVDLGSQNGVYVNGARIQGEQILRPGDRIGLGRYVAIFDLDAAEKQAQRMNAQDPESSHEGPSLLLMHNGQEMERFPLTGEGYVIGRSQRCDIVIGLLGLSRRHARVYPAPDGNWILEDLGSQNGTYVNDGRITGAYQLSAGDVVNFFEYALRYEENPQGQAGEQGSEAPGLSTLVEGAPGGLEESLASGVDPSEAAGFEGGATELEGALGSRSGRMSRLEAAADEPEPPAATGAGWPADAEVESELTASMQLAPSGFIEVRVDNRLLTEVPLDRAALRIGSDARCDVALPPLTSIHGWHLVVVRMGGAALLTRVGDAPLPRVGGRPVCQAFLREGDRVQLGRVTLVYRRR